MAVPGRVARRPTAALPSTEYSVPRPQRPRLNASQAPLTHRLRSEPPWGVSEGACRLRRHVRVALRQLGLSLLNTRYSVLRRRRRRDAGNPEGASPKRCPLGVVPGPSRLSAGRPPDPGRSPFRVALPVRTRARRPGSGISEETSPPALRPGDPSGPATLAGRPPPFRLPVPATL